MALAKSVQHLSSGLSPKDQDAANFVSLVAMRTDHGQISKGEEVHATIAIDAVSHQKFSDSSEVIGKNAIDIIASMEDWKFAG